MRRKIISDYIPGNIGPLKSMLAESAIKGFFKAESSKGTRDVARILTARYGLSICLANREILAPFLRLSEL